MKILILFTTLTALLIGCSTKQEPTSSIPAPLVDGSIDDYKALGVKPVTIADSVNLYTYQNEHYCWLAYDYPEGSFGTMDLKLLSPSFQDTINLHVSAQLGEWMLTPDSPKPDNANSDLWWNANGWTANTVWINGMDRSGEQPRFRFKNANARELQLSKARFGKGQWKLKLMIRSLKGENGEFFDINYPPGPEMMIVNID
ncbi:MAG: hypothetical protein AB7O48_15335 [Cyclobacteriaceae bacterium]